MRFAGVHTNREERRVRSDLVPFRMGFEAALHFVEREDADMMASYSDSVPVSRKKVLLRLLARCEAKRRGLVVSSEEVQAVVDDFRLRYGLITKEEMTEWLRSTGLTPEVFARAMVDFAVVNEIEQIYDRDIAQEIHDHMRISSARERSANGTLATKSAGVPASWLQVNVAMERHEGDALRSARVLFERLSPAIADWRRQVILDRFFFVRKPPDLRLRFLGQNLETHLLAELETILSGLKRDGFVKRFFPSVYEPEVFQFGGAEAMDRVHEHFDADSMAWIALDQLAASGPRTIPTKVVVLAVMNDLFLRTLSCPSEVWDVWCNIASLLQAAQGMHPPTTGIVLIDSLLPHASKEEAHILQDYMRSNQQLSTGLWQIWNNGKLQCGLRAIFPFIAMFHFNRHGLDASARAALAYAMRCAWNPKRRLRGVGVDPPSRVSGDCSGVD